MLVLWISWVHWVIDVLAVLDVRGHGDVRLEDLTRWRRLCSLCRLRTLDQHAAVGLLVPRDEGLSQELLDPLIGYSDGLGPDSSARLLIEALRPDVQHHLLYVLRSQTDEHSEEEVPLNLLCLLQRPLVRHVLGEARQLLGLRPDTGDAQLWPEGELQVALLVLAQEALASAHERLHELKWAVLLLRQVYLQHPIHVLVQVALAPEPLVELLELVVGETSRVVTLRCVHVCGILINNLEAYL